VFDITGLGRGDAREVAVTASADGGAPKQFNARLRIDTPKEREYYRHGGILQYVLRLLASGASGA
jgi:aconitate hydratase